MLAMTRVIAKARIGLPCASRPRRAFRRDIRVAAERLRGLFVVGCDARRTQVEFNQKRKAKRFRFDFFFLLMLVPSGLAPSIAAQTGCGFHG
jgi:hypothetical protein